MQRAALQTPASAAERAQQRAADARHELARAELWPDMSLAGGATLGTGNVVSGGMFQPSGFAGLSGPPTDVQWGPGFQWLTGVSARWDVLALLARVRQVDSALARRSRVDATITVQQQARSIAAGLAWLNAARSAATVEVARMDVDRARRMLTVAQVLVDNGVRPGVERSMAATEVALSEQRLLRAEGQAAATHARLPALIGDKSAHLYTLATPPLVPSSPRSPALHPRVKALHAVVKELHHGVHVARSRFVPRLELAAAGWFRAGNWPPDAAIAAAPNWAAGVVVDFPVLDLSSRAAELRVAQAESDEAEARLAGVRLEVTGQLAEAQALLDAARKSQAQSTAVAHAAEAARTQALARFEAGLIDVTLVVTTQTQAREAELQASMARFDVLTTSLVRDYALGDLSQWMGDRP